MIIYGPDCEGRRRGDVTVGTWLNSAISYLLILPVFIFTFARLHRVRGA